MQKALQQQYYPVKVLEKALAFKDMTNEERVKMEAEVEAIKQLLNNNDEALKQLQQRKTKSVAVLAIVICAGVFLISRFDSDCDFRYICFFFKLNKKRFHILRPFLNAFLN